jgi:uncharacterized membrane protein YccC
MLALYLAFQLQLNEPKWAAMTVWIVAQGSRGMSLSKGRNRILGTLTGAVVALCLIGLFSQTVPLLMVALAAWVGVCTGLATALRNFRSYSAVLAGYTAAIVAMAALPSPSHAFDIATARVIYIILGIVVEGLMAAIFSIDDPGPAIRARYLSYLRQAAEVCARALQKEPNAAALHRLIADLSERDTVLEYAAAASAEVRAQAMRYRRGDAAVLQLLAATQSIREQRAEPRYDTDIDPLIDETAALLQKLADGDGDTEARRADDDRHLIRLRAGTDARLQSEALHPDGSHHSAQRLVMLDRLMLLLSALVEARDALNGTTRPTLRPALASFRERLHGFAFHVDAAKVWQNGIRAFVAVLAATLIWWGSAWQNGGGFVAITAVVCGLFATRPNPVKGSIGFLTGTLWAVLAALLCNAMLIPAVSGFTMLCLVLGPFLLVVGVAMRTPRWTAIATGFSIFFLDFVGPDNTQRTADVTFINNALSTAGGIAFSALVFGVLSFAFLQRPQRIRERLDQAMFRDLRRIVRGQDMAYPASAPPPRVWLSRTADRMRAIGAGGKDLGTHDKEQAIRRLLAGWLLGSTVMTARLLTARAPRARRPVEAVLSHLGRSPVRRQSRVCLVAAGRLQRQAAAIGTTDIAMQGTLLHLAVVLLSIGDIAQAHPDILAGLSSRPAR